ncbi:MAG TPA: class I SAM-dependent methyltransferase [Isosphaeraceae bacterium]|nr:class I SAM-dependent methyltransferase [Isosphaeraceae bacterium]
MPRCVILVPAIREIEPRCEDGLRRLEQRGYPVWRVRSGVAIDLARSQMAFDALAAGYDELMWIDPDIGFEPEEVERIRHHPHPLVAGLYPRKGKRELAAALLPGTKQVRFGPNGGVFEVRYASFGFVLTRRILFEKIQQTFKIPICNQRLGRPVVPWFAPMVIDDGGGPWYLREDFAFCERTRQVGIPILADSSLRLWHLGTQALGWEDAGGEIRRSPDYTYHVGETIQAQTGPAMALDPTSSAPRSRPPRNILHEAARSLPASFPTMQAYCVSYLANRPSLDQTLEHFRESDWGEEPLVFMQPNDWPRGKPAASRNYRRVLEHAYQSQCDFALILEDDVRVNRWLRHNLTTIPLIRRDQCDYLSLFMPDLILDPWERQEPHLGYRLAKPMYAGPNRMWERSRIWGSQGYLLSRRFLRIALERWDQLTEGQDTRIITLCSERKLPLWYTSPCLLEHAPLQSAFGTPTAHAPDFDRDFRLEVQPGFQPPEEVPGWLAIEEGQRLWFHARDRRVLELGTAAGRSTVCLAQNARRVVSIDQEDPSEAREWCRRYQVDGGVEFLQGRIEQIVPRLEERFDMAFVDIGHDRESVARAIEASLRILEPGGLVAFQGYPDPCWPEVRQVVDDHANRLSWKRLDQTNFLAIFQTVRDSKIKTAECRAGS